VSVNTAIATTATANSSAGAARVGRFAPSPTGPLHLGSLVAAVGSYLDARQDGGRWLLRIEDLDTPRVVPGCADEMLRVLETFGFEWSGAVMYQSKRRWAYQAALDELRRAGRTFECSCSRKTRHAAAADTDGAVYSGTCRNGPTQAGPTATRFRVDDDSYIRFDDALQGPQTVALRDVGDVVVRRRDDLPTYQLAVVVDDAAQGITRVTRGCDLLASTPWQVALQAALRLPAVKYAHLPLVTEPDGAKLAKSRRSIAVERAHIARQLVHALQLLRQQPPAALAADSVTNVWAWAHAHWQPGMLQRVRNVQLSPASDTFTP
jgi:glutamyl-Q tRNA(Asp) synthetase